jgi:hypothetical protein
VAQSTAPADRRAVRAATGQAIVGPAQPRRRSLPPTAAGDETVGSNRIADFSARWGGRAVMLDRGAVQMAMSTPFRGSGPLSDVRGRKHAATDRPPADR